MPLRGALCVLVAWLGAGSSAYAQSQCSYSATPSASFGSVTSFTAQSSGQSTSASTVASCGGGLLNVLVVLGESPYLRATMSGSAHNYQLVNAAGDAVAYAAYAGPNGQYPLTPGVAFNYYQQTVLNALGLLGGTGGNVPMYFITTAGGNLSAGTYTDTFTINWSWKICNIGVAVCLGYTSGSGTATVTLTMTVTNACQISAAPDIDFGSAPVADHFPAINQSVSVLCTKGFAAYSVGLDPGQHASGSRRRMTKGGTAFLEYDIFDASTNAVWGFSGSGRVTNTAQANGSTPQAFPYRAQVYADQTTPAVGHYSDSVVLNVSW